MKAIFITILAALSYGTHAQTIFLDAAPFTATFNEESMAPDGPNTNDIPDVVSETFFLNLNQIQDFSFEANFTIIDAGIEILINGMPLFNTGNDISEFAPNGGPFDVTLDNLFAPSSTPRLSVSADATGTFFSGAITPDAAPTTLTAIDFTPNNDITSLLIEGENTIVINNLNTFGGAGLAGDFTIAIPEPSALGLLGLGTLLLFSHRKR